MGDEYRRRLGATIERDGSTVKILVDTRLGTERPRYPFSFRCADDETAEMLRLYITENIQFTFRQIRKIEYEMGWSDAKKKRKKKDYFSGCIL